MLCYSGGMSKTQTTTVQVPADTATYARWLAGRVSAMASTVRRADLGGDPIPADEREQLADAARTLLAELDA